MISLEVDGRLMMIKSTIYIVSFTLSYGQEEVIISMIETSCPAKPAKPPE